VATRKVARPVNTRALGGIQLMPTRSLTCSRDAAAKQLSDYAVQLLAELLAIKVFDYGRAIPESDEGASGRVVVS